MKACSVILAFLIFSTSLKASAFVSGAMNAFQGEVSSVSCCKSGDTNLADECELPQEENEDSGCCEGENCDCTCCLHIAYITYADQVNGAGDDFAEVKFCYSFQYQADYLSAVFHPPSKA